MYFVCWTFNEIEKSIDLHKMENLWLIISILELSMSAWSHKLQNEKCTHPVSKFANSTLLKQVSQRKPAITYKLFKPHLYLTSYSRNSWATFLLKLNQSIEFLIKKLKGLLCEIEPQKGVNKKTAGFSLIKNGFLVHGVTNPILWILMKGRTSFN